MTYAATYGQVIKRGSRCLIRTSSLFAFTHRELRLGLQLCFSGPLEASVQIWAKTLTDSRWPISSKFCLSALRRLPLPKQP